MSKGEISKVNNQVNSLEQAVSNLPKEKLEAILVKSLEGKVEIENKAAQQNQDYITGRKVVEDHIDSFNQLNRESRTTRHSMKNTIKTGAGELKIESKTGATCFVASAAYGDPNHPDVMFLRYYRDRYLTKSKIGRLFIKIYWCIGPILATPVKNVEILQLTTKRAIGLFVKTLKLKLKETT